MQDVLVLLQHLAENEETTIKLIIECLYDVGTVNFINTKVDNTSINQLTKTIAGMSKPVAKRFGYRWFKKNCPDLIVNWLQRKVAFPPPKVSPSPPAEVEAQPDIIKAVEVAEAQAQVEAKVYPSNIASSSSKEKAEDRPSTRLTMDAIDSPETQTMPISSPLESAGEVKDTTPPPFEAPPETEREPEPYLAPTPLSASSLDVQGIEEHSPVVTPATTTAKARPLPTPMEQTTRQIRRLKNQNRALMGALVGTILVGGVTIWQLHVTQQNANQLRHSTSSLIVPANQ